MHPDVGGDRDREDGVRHGRRAGGVRRQDVRPIVPGDLQRVPRRVKQSSTALTRRVWWTRLFLSDCVHQNTEQGRRDGYLVYRRTPLGRRGG